MRLSQLDKHFDFYLFIYFQPFATENNQINCRLKHIFKIGEHFLKLKWGGREGKQKFSLKTT